MGGRQANALILDIDGTLIDSCASEEWDLWINNDVKNDHITDCGEVIRKRPGLDAFLDVAFASGPVALWTHAPARWADIMVNQVMLTADGSPRPWAFVWS